MILNLSITNYRSFKEETSFSMITNGSNVKSSNYFTQSLAKGEDEARLLKVASIFGPNASGKTNLIRLFFEFISYLVNKPKMNQGVPLYDPFIFDVKTKNEPISFSIEFALDNIKYKYSITISRDTVLSEELVYYPEKKPRVIYTRIIDGSSTISHEAKFGSDIKGIKWTGFPNQLILSSFGDDIPNPIISNVYSYFSEIKVVNFANNDHLRSLKEEVDVAIANDPDLHKQMNELISLADTKLKGVKLEETILLESSSNREYKQESKGYKVYGIHNLYDGDKYMQEEYLPFAQESRGTYAFYCLGGMILKCLKEGKIILIDEIETSLHAELTKLLISLFLDEKINSRNVQSIITTHETSLLDKNLLRRDQIWFVDKNEFGVTDLYSLQDFDSVREDTPFDRWYVAGKFGGIPQIRSLQSFGEEGK